MKLSTEPNTDTSEREAPNTDSGITQGLPRFFRAANYIIEGRRSELTHKTPIPKKSKVEILKPKLEFIEQLLTETHPSDAPILIAYEKSHTIDVLTFEGERICELVGHDSKITAAKALSDKVIVTGDASGVLMVWDLTSKEVEKSERNSSKKGRLNKQHLLKRLHEHTGAITAIEAINGQNFVSASLDCSYRYWHIDFEKSVQTIESLYNRPILSLAQLTEDVVLYCVESFVSKNLYSYDIVKCRRSDRLHTIIGQPSYSISSLMGAITHIKLMPDGHLAVIDQMENSGTVITHTKNVSLYAKPPSTILSNGRFAFLGRKRNVIVEQFPLIDKPMLSVEVNEIKEEERAPVGLVKDL